MNTASSKIRMSLVAGSIALALASCASAPTAPEGAAEVRARLTRLQADPQLASRARIEIAAAETAVSAAERRQRDNALAQHLVMMADYKVEIASSWAQSRLYEDQRVELNRQAELARLASRTREAEVARSDADLARRDADSARDATAQARSQAEIARGEADAARSATNAARSQTERAQVEAEAARSAAETARGQTTTARTEAEAARNAAERATREAEAARSDAGVARDQAALARQEAEELQRRLGELNARDTDRGLVVTLGDVLFETGRAELRGGTAGNLDSLADFLNRYQDRSVLIEGHTDSVGTDSSNQVLSRQRADAVRDYLVSRNVSAARITATGLGEGTPVADNESATGRQQNRRVEVIISDPD